MCFNSVAVLVFGYLSCGFGLQSKLCYVFRVFVVVIILAIVIMERISVFSGAAWSS